MNELERYTLLRCSFFLFTHRHTSWSHWCRHSQAYICLRHTTLGLLLNTVRSSVHTLHIFPTKLLEMSPRRMRTYHKQHLHLSDGSWHNVPGKLKQRLTHKPVELFSWGNIKAAKLQWIFNGDPENIQGNFDRYKYTCIFYHFSKLRWHG